jgi:nicotinamide/nicotinate riboside kinase
MTDPTSNRPKALIVGISGPSSSGKTTLARLLQRVFCGVPLNTTQSLNTFIIHEDDFYYPDDQ